MRSLFEQIPGLREAVEREQFQRVAAFLPLPEFIGPVRVSPLTLNHLNHLEAIGSPFVHGGTPGPLDVARLLWILSPHFGKNRLCRWWFMRRLGRLQYGELLTAIDSYFEEAFVESPGGAAAHGPQYLALSAAVVDLIASEYGWSDQDILNLPLKRLFAYYRAASRRHDPHTPLFNPSDKLRGQWLEKMEQYRQTLYN